MLNDLRLTLRSLAKNPGFAGVAIVTLALGIGASTAIFSVMNGVLLRPLPYPDSDRLMQIETEFESGNTGRVSYPNFADLRERSRSFAGMAAYADWTTSAAAGGEGFRVDWALVSPGFFSVLGVAPDAGRVFSAEEEQSGRRVAVISHGYWQSRLAGTEDLAGRSIRVGDDVYDVIGVMPRGYEFPLGTELWVPREPATESRTAHNWSVIGRLRDGVSPAQARQDLSSIARRLKQQHGDETWMVDAAVRPLLERLVGDVRAALWVLLGAAGLLLLVACVNVANLLLARSLSRDRESALRLALGAGPGSLARLFLTESLVLSLSAAGLGLAVALAGVPALLALEPGRLPRLQEIGVDGSVLAFALAASVLVATVVGLVPAVRAARRDMREALADGQRIQGGSPASHRLRAGLVVAQIALTVVLLVGAGLLGRSLLNLLAVDPGFRTDGALVMDVWLPEACGGSGLECDADRERRNSDFIAQLIERLQGIPGVERVGGINHLPLDGGGPNGRFISVQRPDEITSFEDYFRFMPDPSRTGDAEFRVASAGYFRTMGIPLMRGRLFDARDTPDGPHAAVISASLAETRWPDENPLGKLIFFGNMDADIRSFTVVGVVGDVQEYGLGAEPLPTFYADHRQRPRTASAFHVVVQGELDAAAATSAARRAADELDSAVPVAFRTLDDVVGASLADRRFVLLLLALFGGVALVLAATGVYGVVAYMAAQRTPEIGVRVALGAGRRDVVRLLLRHGAAFAVAGVAVGLAGAFALTRVIASFLYDIGTADPATFAGAAAVLLLAVIAASWIPARRAAGIDAVEALRHR